MNKNSSGRTRQLSSGQWKKELCLAFCCEIKEKVSESVKNWNDRCHSQGVKSLKWKWAGHIARMEDERWTKRILEWRLFDEIRLVG